MNIEDIVSGKGVESELKNREKNLDLLKSKLQSCVGEKIYIGTLNHSYSVEGGCFGHRVDSRELYAYCFLGIIGSSEIDYGTKQLPIPVTQFAVRIDRDGCKWQSKEFPYLGVFNDDFNNSLRGEVDGKPQLLDYETKLLDLDYNSIDHLFFLHQHHITIGLAEEIGGLLLVGNNSVYSYFSEHGDEYYTAMKAVGLDEELPESIAGDLRSKREEIARGIQKKITRLENLDDEIRAIARSVERDYYDEKDIDYIKESHTTEERRLKKDTEAKIRRDLESAIELDMHTLNEDFSVGEIRFPVRSSDYISTLARQFKVKL